MGDGARNILIVGGGFSGAALAIQLAQRGVAATLIESRERVGRGAAYSTPNDEHLLNVPAGRMGLFADAPGGFADYAASEGVRPHDFVSRRQYGDYVAEALQAVTADGRVEIVRGRAVAARALDGGWQVELANGETRTGAGLVLANGNQPPAGLPVDGLDARRRVDDPWSEQGRARIAEAARGKAAVAMLGSGLTMVDVVLTLDRLGFEGLMFAVSRRGLLPRPHLAEAVAPVTAAVDDVPLTLPAAVRWLRRRAAETGNWRGTIDGLRPVTQAIWQRMTVAEQQRFLRHARPWWDVHRHRIAPRAADTIQRLVDEGRLQIIAGRVTRASDDGERAMIEIAKRSGGIRRVGAGVVVNCTGPLGSIAQSEDPLIRQLLADGLARADPLGLGLAVEADDRLAGHDRAWAIGPMTKGRYWEITAVPDIRIQADDIAGDIASVLEMNNNHIGTKYLTS